MAPLNKIGQVIAGEINVLLFDGVCNLCNSSVNFVIDHDKKNLLHFSALQSEAGSALVEHFKLADVDSLILIYRGRAYTRSAAAIRTGVLFGGIYRLLAVFLLIPPFLRDPLYDFIARNRYRWFGRRDTCRMPEPGLKKRFLE